ncbi:hypothetical protein KHA80_14385 [Anaerobacillus sp. HL2]|nr:hypothetical protein KHA80_14385 [Anaerobacillus sp. HL2]
MNKTVGEIRQISFNEFGMSFFVKELSERSSDLSIPLEFEIPDDQPVIVLMGMMTLRFVVPQTIEEVNY